MIAREGRGKIDGGAGKAYASRNKRNSKYDNEMSSEPQESFYNESEKRLLQFVK